jgi:hypothetical protein
MMLNRLVGCGDCQGCARLTSAEPHAKETSHRPKAMTSSDQRRQHTLRPDRGFCPRKFLHGLTACVVSAARQPFLRLDSVVAHLPSCPEWVFPDPSSRFPSPPWASRSGEMRAMSPTRFAHAERVSRLLRLPFRTSNPDHVMGPSVSTLATCSQLLPSVEQHQSVGAKGQSMRHRSVARQCDPGGAFLSRQKAGENHARPESNSLPWQKFSCLLNWGIPSVSTRLP